MTELEAYAGKEDPASHAFGARTDRNAPMYGPPGTLYVYLSYGIHWCANIVVGPEGHPSAVLMRGAKIVEGREVIEARRGRKNDLVNGPGKLGQALGLTGADSGTDVWNGPLRLGGTLGSVLKWTATPRIGITRATDRLWRFVADD